MLDTEIIRRLAYDGNYENAIRLLVEIVEKQQKEIEELKNPEFITKKFIQLYKEKIQQDSEV